LIRASAGCGLLAAPLGAQFHQRPVFRAGGLRTLDGRKTLVLMSGGLPAGDRIGGRPDVNGLITTIGEHAARSHVNLDVLHMDTSFLDMFSVTGRTLAQSAMRDSGVLGLGLERFTGTADRGGRPHFIHVRVKRRGATVRSRAMVTIPVPGGN
jgi:hypothetical protein